MSSIQQFFEKEVSRRIELLEKMYIIDKNLPTKTDLNETEIEGLSVIQATDVFFKQNWDIDMGLEDMLIIPICSFKISRKRLGRKEIVEVLRSILGSIPTQEEPSKSKKFFGIG